MKRIFANCEEFLWKSGETLMMPLWYKSTVVFFFGMCTFSPPHIHHFYFFLNRRLKVNSLLFFSLTLTRTLFIVIFSQVIHVPTRIVTIMCNYCSYSSPGSHESKNWLILISVHLKININSFCILCGGWSHRVMENGTTMLK